GHLIEQILHNILQNAIQYTPAGTEVQFKVNKREKRFEIEITDNGKGFPTDKMDLVFDKFYRLPDSAAGGTGLGLSIAKGFANAHNGDIKLENVPTGGAKFTIFIPAES